MVHRLEEDILLRVTILEALCLKKFTMILQARIMPSRQKIIIDEISKSYTVHT